jgi:hypothetical protein
LRSEGRGVEFAGFVEDWAGEEEAGSAVFTSGECVVVALGGGDGSIGGPGAGFSGGALGGSGSDYLERGFVEEINGPNQGLEGRVGEGDFLFEVSGYPLRGEEHGVGEDGAAERGENLLPPEGDLVGNDSGLNGEGPQDDVVEPPAAALEIVLETVNVALVDGSTDCRFRSKEDGNRDREGKQEERLCLGGQDSCQTRRDGSDIRVGERDAVLVGPEAEKVGDRDRGLDDDKGDLGNIEGKEFRAERRGVVRPMDEEEVLLAVLGVGRPRCLNNLGEEDGLDVSFVVEDVDAREDSGILEGAEALLVGSANVGSGRHSGSGRGSTKVRDVLRGGAIARGS